MRNDPEVYEEARGGMEADHSECKGGQFSRQPPKDEPHIHSLAKISHLFLLDSLLLGYSNMF